MVKQFKTAMNKSLEYATRHPDEARAVLATYTKIDQVRAALTLPQWPDQIDTDSVQHLADLPGGRALQTSPT